MKKRTQEEVADEAEQNRRSLLRAEAAALLLLRRRRDETIRKGLRRGHSIQRITVELQVTMRLAIADSRLGSRGAGIARLRGEIRSVGAGLKEGGTALLHETQRDLARAGALARTYADRWHRKAVGDDVSEAASVASSATEGSLRRIGVTESSEAFSSGRTAYLRIVRDRHFYRVWDSVLDHRTCLACARADGTIVRRNESFPLGEPGTVHPWCRCDWTLLSSLESDDLMLIEAA